MMSYQGRVELFGGAPAIAVLGSIGTAYRNRVAETVPVGVPLDTAREAFTQALQLTAIVSAVFVAGTAILDALLLRNVRSDSGPDGEPNTVPDAAIAESVGSKEAPGPALTAPENGVPVQVEL